MTSQTDLDQGGTSRQMVRQWMGPSIGWIEVPAEASSILVITAAGTYSINLSTTLVTVNVAGSVTLNLPSVLGSKSPPIGQPGVYTARPITIVDIGGNAQAHPIVINPASGAENIMGLTTVSLTVNFGGFTFKPIAAMSGWENISP